MVWPWKLILFTQHIAESIEISHEKASRLLSALVIKYEFVKHNDTYFHNLWPYGNPNPLPVKSEISGFGGNLYTGCPKIVSTKVLNDFFMLEIWPWVLAMSKMQNCHLLDLFYTEKLWKKQKNCSSPICSIKTMKMCFFNKEKRDKRWPFCVLVNCRVNGNIFRILKSSITFIDTIFEHPVYRFPKKPEIFNFTVSWFELPWGHRLWKYMPLCLTNLYFMANALRNRVRFIKLIV